MPTPPLPELLAYRLVGWRLGPAHREWVVTDIRSRAWPLRQSVVVAPAVCLPLAIVFAATGASPTRLAFPLLGVLVLFVFLRKALADRALRQQGLTSSGEPDPGAALWYDDDAARHRRNLGAAVTTVGLVGAAVLMIALNPGR